MGFAVSSVLGVAVAVGAVCPSGITIGVVEEELSFSPPFLPPLLSPTPPFETSDGGQDKSVGGQFVFSVPPPPPPPPTLNGCVTSLLFVLLLLLSALAAPAVATVTTAATTAAAAARLRLLIRSRFLRRC
jgi:hypothetical protein